jgi:hypothetical protein
LEVYLVLACKPINASFGGITVKYQFLALTIPLSFLISLVQFLPAKAQSSSSDNSFLQTVNSQLLNDSNPLVFIPNDQKIEHAQSVCRGLHSGLTFDEWGISFAAQIVKEIENRKLSKWDGERITSYAGTIAGASVVYYCPQYRQQVVGG